MAQDLRAEIIILQKLGPEVSLLFDPEEGEDSMRYDFVIDGQQFLF